MATLLLVDDDRALVALLQSALCRYQTIFASDGESALHQLTAEHPDLVLMDLKLPDLDGVILITKIRETSAVPIVVLSGRHEQVDIVSALHNGADDFLTKPFDIDDLEARIGTVLRRSARVPITQDGQRVGSFHISDMKLATIDGSSVYLSPLEYKLVKALVSRAGDVVSRGELATVLYDSPDEDYYRLVDLTAGRVRMRLAGHPGAPAIETVRGHGYRIAQAVGKETP